MSKVEKKTMERTIKHDLSASPQDKLFTLILLIKVDTIAAPALYIVDQLYPWSLRTSLKYADSYRKFSHIPISTQKVR